MAAAVLVVAGAGAALLVPLLQRPQHGFPAERDFVAIAQVTPQPSSPQAGPDGSPGSFVSSCGRNENGHVNTDNVIFSPGQVGGAHHMHEYVGNTSTDASSSDAILAAAATTCSNDDASTYYWPALRILPGDPGDPGVSDSEPAGLDGGHHNPGTRIVPAAVLVQFRGNPTSKVVAIPRFLRLFTGNPFAVTAPASAGTAQWSCTGSPDRRTPLYPLCPAGQQVLRIYDFPNCWDGRRTDSPNHHDQATFSAPDGHCPRDFFPIPQLHLEVADPVPPGRSYAIDTFPDQRRSPTTDHAQYINVMPDPLMAQVVACLNSGRRC